MLKELDLVPQAVVLKAEAGDLTDLDRDDEREQRADARDRAQELHANVVGVVQLAAERLA